MKIVSTEQLGIILLGLDNKQATFASVLQFTDAKPIKKDRQTKEPHGFTSVKKLTALNVLLNSNYQNGVVNQLEREGKDESEYKQGKNTMPLDKSMSNNNFCGTFNDNVVIEYRPFDNSNPRTKYIANGKLTDKAKLGDILPTKSKATNQGTEKEIHWRKLYVKNIRKIKIGGQIYKVVN